MPLKALQSALDTARGLLYKGGEMRPFALFNFVIFNRRHAAPPAADMRQPGQRRLKPAGFASPLCGGFCLFFFAILSFPGKAAAEEAPEQLLNQGINYENGHNGLPKDPAKAAELYQKILDQIGSLPFSFEDKPKMRP